MNSSQLLTASRAINSTIHQSPWGSHAMEMESSLQQQSNLRTVLACVLSFLATAISSAGGVGVGAGGGSLYVPILNAVAGLSLKKSTASSTFMVTGGTLSSLLYTLFARPDGQPLIDYDVAVVSQPCLLLGVSVGVACNVMFPDWLIFALFSAFLSFATFKTYRSGMRRWRGETEARRRVLEGASTGEGTEEPLSDQTGGGGGHGCHWADLVVLVTVWLCFFVMHLFIGGERVKGVFDMKPCGVAYWLITAAQIPIAVAFTACIVHHKRKLQARNSQMAEPAIAEKSRLDALPVYAFPVTLLTGVMIGLFGIGGGLLLNPVLLKNGVPPKTASATTMFMVLFCASMSMVQFIILGVHGIVGALVYAAVCFVASIVGLVVIEGAILRKSGRVSIVVLMVAAFLVLSKLGLGYSGAVRIYAQYTSGKYMGFKRPC